MIATMLVQANDSQPWYLCGYLLVAGVISTASTIWIGNLRLAKAEPRVLPDEENSVLAPGSASEQNA